MRLAVLADIHACVDHLDAALDHLAAADVVVLAGDLVGFGSPERASPGTIARILDTIRARVSRTVAVHGNCDLPAVTDYLNRTDTGIDGRTVEIDGMAFLGLGGSLPCPEPTPCELDEPALEAGLARAADQWSGAIPAVLVSHQPPHATRADFARIGSHVGSHAVRAFIEARQPLLCISGHIHEGYGIDRIGATTVLNPGAFREGRWATCEIAQGEVRTELHRAEGSRRIPTEQPDCLPDARR